MQNRSRFQVSAMIAAGWLHPWTSQVADPLSIQVSSVSMALLMVVLRSGGDGVRRSAWWWRDRRGGVVDPEEAGGQAGGGFSARERGAQRRCGELV
jgi:hypothetical protein